MSTPSSENTNIAGGAATGGGMNFQAAVTTIAYIYMARGQKLNWLNAIDIDVPVSVEAETGGPGDDIKIQLKTGRIVEIQVKKGLRSGDKLWTSLLSLASAATTGEIDYGILIVSPTSSGTITNDLARDIIRLGDGRFDNLSKTANAFCKLLEDNSLPIIEVCRKLRIQTVNALDNNNAHILAAKSELSHLCATNQITPAWNALYSDATKLVETKGRRDISSILRVLNSEEIKLKEQLTNEPILLLEKACNWSFEVCKFFSVWGINKQVMTDKAWIPLRAVVQKTPEEYGCLSTAIKTYQSWDMNTVSNDDIIINPETLARFQKKVVLVGGPGMGKTTLLKRIARRYSEDKIPTLRVRLISVAARMQTGGSFEEAVFELGLDGSGISSNSARDASFSNWLLLCDGLDECGKMQEAVADGVTMFTKGHPECRVIITTRPIGYESSHFNDWKHYCIAPLDFHTAEKNLRLLLENLDESVQSDETYFQIATAGLGKEEVENVISRNPLLLALAAAIIIQQKHLGTTKYELFRQTFALIGKIPNKRVPEHAISCALLDRFLEIIGWHIALDPLTKKDALLYRCAQELSIETEYAPLKAHIEATACLQYWQDLGMLEIIGWPTEQVVVFIHKSFGEFIAARYLSNLLNSTNPNALPCNFFSEDFSEILRFTSMQGSSEIICKILLEHCNHNQDNSKIISLALQIITESNNPPHKSIRRSVFSLAASLASSTRRVIALDIGTPLTKAAAVFPEEVGPVVSKLLESKQSWTALIGWSAAVSAGPKHYDLHQLQSAMLQSIDKEGLNSTSPLRKSSLLYKNPALELLELFILNSSSVLLCHFPTETTKRMIVDVLRNPPLGTLGYLKKVNRLLPDIYTQITKKTAEDVAVDYDQLIDFSAWDKPISAFLNALFDCFGIQNTTKVITGNKQTLLHLSAFFAASKLNDLPIHDFVAWTKPYDKEATSEVLRTFVGATGLNLEMLKADMVMAKLYLAEGKGLHELTTDVDPPLVNWSLATSLTADRGKIETGLHHRSQWIAQIATLLINAMLPEDELAPAVERALNHGQGHTLFFACLLARRLKDGSGISLILKRLRGPVVPGYNQLLSFLKDKNLQWQNDFESLLQAPLHSDPVTARAAAELSISLAKPGLDSLFELLVAAYHFWLENEAPYPRAGGIIPVSPRAALVEARIKIRQPSYDDFLALISDERNDVRAFSENKLIAWLCDPAAPRERFLSDILSGKIKPTILRNALKQMAPLSEAEMKIWNTLLHSKDDIIRFSSMVLLDNHYLDKETIKAIAIAMTNDENQDIKDNAYTILDSIYQK